MAHNQLRRHIHSDCMVVTVGNCTDIHLETLTLADRYTLGNTLADRYTLGNTCWQIYTWKHTGWQIYAWKHSHLLTDIHFKTPLHYSESCALQNTFTMVTDVQIKTLSHLHYDIYNIYTLTLVTDVHFITISDSVTVRWSLHTSEQFYSHRAVTSAHTHTLAPSVCTWPG